MIKIRRRKGRESSRIFNGNAVSFWLGPQNKGCQRFRDFNVRCFPIYAKLAKEVVYNQP